MQWRGRAPADVGEASQPIRAHGHLVGVMTVLVNYGDVVATENRELRSCGCVFLPAGHRRARAASGVEATARYRSA